MGIHNGVNAPSIVVNQKFSSFGRQTGQRYQAFHSDGLVESRNWPTEFPTEFPAESSRAGRDESAISSACICMSRCNVGEPVHTRFSIYEERVFSNNPVKPMARVRLAANSKAELIDRGARSHSHHAVGN